VYLIRDSLSVDQKAFAPFEGMIERIVLARAEPYEELKAWALKESSE